MTEQTSDRMRQAFEAWAKQHGSLYPLTPGADDISNYEDWDTHHAWQAWQAATVAAVGDGSKLVEYVEAKAKRYLEAAVNCKDRASGSRTLIGASLDETAIELRAMLAAAPKADGGE